MHRSPTLLGANACHAFGCLQATVHFLFRPHPFYWRVWHERQYPLFSSQLHWWVFPNYSQTGLGHASEPDKSRYVLKYKVGGIMSNTPKLLLLKDSKCTYMYSCIITHVLYLSIFVVNLEPSSGCKDLHAFELILKIINLILDQV